MSDNRKYTSEDVRRYLEGKLTPAEMHALERAALEDPFLADALEGMQSYGDIEQFASDVAELKERFHQQRKRKRQPIAPGRLWLKIAAVLVIVITGVAIIIFTGEKNRLETAQLAKSEKEQPRATTQDTFSARTEAPAVDTTAAKPTGLGYETAAAEPPKKPKATRAKPTAEKKSEQDQQFQASEAEIPAASQTDAAQTQPPTASAGATDTTFAEVVIIGSGATKNRALARAKGVTAERKSPNVLPATGWDEFEKYMNNGFDINTSDSTLNGEERVSFSIDDNGSPEAIKILKSLSPAHDREAIRLLREGPAWKVPQGSNKNITLKLIF